MHTMYHRKAPTGSTAAAAASVGTTNGTAKVQQQSRRRKMGSSSSAITLGRNDLIMAILSTFVLTVVIVVFIVKLYWYVFISTNHNNNNKPKFFVNPMAKRNLQKDGGGNGGVGGGESSNGENGDDDAMMPYNELYRIPNSMRTVGDRTDRYIQLRMEMDAILPTQQYDRSLLFVQDLVHNNPYVHHTGIIQPAPQEDLLELSKDMTGGESDEESGGGIQEPKVISKQQQQHNSDQVTNPTYDIYNCPDVPPEGYPYAWNMIQLLQNWPPDITTPPTSNMIYQSICVFDYQVDYNKAMTYRTAELPFITVNDPAVAETVERWNTLGYIPRLMGSAMHRTEFSENNHFMYFVPPPKNKQRLMMRQRNNNNNKNNNNKNNKVPSDWRAPTKLIRMSYMEWLRHANVTDEKQLGPDHPHWYYRLIGCGTTGPDGSCDTETSEYLFDELTFFQPKSDQLYIVDPEEQKGIHCRFGMKGVIAENHFDGSRNAIVVLGGSRRYILSHPNQCEHLALYPKGHPSARHSAVDWSNPDLNEFPQFARAMGNEMVLTAGQVLYLPTEWFHYIVSLELNYQCNTRSGITKHYRQFIKKCGF